jgi:epoxyqueuosine reductase
MKGKDPVIQAELIQHLEQAGYQARIVSTRRLADLRAGIAAPHKGGLLDPAFYEQRLATFTFQSLEALSEARSLIVVAMPQPSIRFTFGWAGAQRPVLVPPTYLHWQETDRRIQAALVEVLEPEGYHVARSSLPKKLLAARSGLAAYGRNNIAYIPGRGSYVRLAAFHSDLPCAHDDWQEPRIMGRCQACRACAHACPTGAIPSDRFLLRAERCIVYHNEQPGDVPFPAWLDSAAHNCLVGCMHCQNVCPVNREVVDWVKEGATFSELETALLLEGTPLDRLPEATARKLEQWDLVELYDLLPRNLRVLLGQDTQGSGSRAQSAGAESGHRVGNEW